MKRGAELARPDQAQGLVARIKAEAPRWGKVVQDAKIQPE